MKIYQLGFKRGIYYCPTEIAGDWFGPARYSDFMDKASSRKALREHLARLGLNSILIHKAREPFRSLAFGDDFADCFKLVTETERAVLYTFR